MKEFAILGVPHGKAMSITQKAVSLQSAKLSPTICDYEQLIPIGYNYNQFGINDVSKFDWLGLHFMVRLHTPNN